MPSAAQILSSLHDLANDYRGAALLWHIQIAGAALALFFSRSRPSMDLAGYLLTLPIVSVSVLSSHGGNVANGAAFLLLTGALALSARSMPRAPVRGGAKVDGWFGGVSLFVGIAYPHFVVVTSPIQ